MIYPLTWTAARFDPKENILYDSFPSEVPGNVQYDYALHHGFGDYQFSNRVDQFKCLENYWWIYRASLQYTANKDERICFIAEGIDYNFDIRLDGAKIYSSQGMFTPVELDITDIAVPGSLLEIVIHPHPMREGAPVGRDQADQSCKPPFCYGWDWNPRLLISGLWRDAYIETRCPDYIHSCEPFYSLNETLDSAQVTFVTDCNAQVLYTLYDADGIVVYQGIQPDFQLTSPKLWWCNGQGVPYLYTWTAETAHCKKTGTIGFRTIRLVHNIGADQEPIAFPKSRYAAPITIELNGKRIFACGSNWVSPDLFPGRVDEKRYRTLLTAAKDANMNILRIWGGSGINKPEFYDICDELGIMVWQEFMLACNNYVGTESYLSILEQEARSILRSLRHHPSLVLWCGGNELFNGWSGMDEQSHALRLLNKLCYEEDITRPFLYTSPLVGMAHGGYFFRDPADGRDVFELFSSSHNTAYTEFGVPSLAPIAQLQKIIPSDELFPVAETPAWTAHHGFHAWIDDSWVGLNTINHYFGHSATLEELVQRSSWLQSAGYQAIFEEARRQWPYCSMAIQWCYNEPWITAANNSILSYPDVKKPAYDTIQNALRPILSSARIPHFQWQAGECFSAEIWLLNNSNHFVAKTITAIIQLGDEEYEQISWNSGLVEAHTNKLGPTIHFTLPNVDCDTLVLKLITSDGEGDSSYCLSYRPMSSGKGEKKLNM